MVRVDRAFGRLEPDLQAPDDIQLPDDGVSADDRYADLLPAPKSDLQVDEPAQLEDVSSVAEVTGTGPMGQTRRVWKCWSPLQRAFRRDVIERAATEPSRTLVQPGVDCNLSTVMASPVP